MSEGNFVRVDREGPIGIVTIDRQDKLNALNRTVIEQLDRAFDEVRRDDAVRVVILTGAGEKAFVAGADIGELSTMDPVSGVEISRLGQEVFLRIERFRCPVIAAVGGYALGGGCELSLACHVRVASENARFGLPEVGLGIIPGYGGTVRLARLVGLGRAVEMTLTAQMVGAERALEIGLVTSVVPREELIEHARSIASTIAKNGPVALRMAMESIYQAQEVSTRDALQYESSLFGLLASTTDMKEGMAAFLEKRKAEFEGR